MNKALYRKYRSTSLDTVVGQSHITDVLKRAIETGRIAHAYLLTGPRGVGKTSVARILAHEIIKAPYVSEELPLDIIEIDAASNNGIDDVRDLRDKARLAPVKAERKVYIIDEVHMLSKQAFNALLKTLEEPPEHIVFILATTNPEKLPDTIISRTQQFVFRPINSQGVAAHLAHIASEEKIAIDDDALTLIAERGGGSFRDSISLFDQIAGFGDGKTPITRQLIETNLGLAPQQLVDQLLDAATTHDPQAILSLLTTSEEHSIAPLILIDQLLSGVRARLATSPDLVTLIDVLLAARESSRPELKLLTGLTLFHAPSAKPVAKTMPAVAAALPSVSAPIKTAKKVEKPPVVASAPEVKTPEVAPVEETPAPAPKKPAAPSGPFDWQTLIDYTQKRYIALYSVLTKCTPEVDGTTLRLYTGRKFNKTKLDDVKYRPLLTKSLLESGLGDYEIETIPTAPPPSDPSAAAVAAIMGGGEQVDVSA